jgi:NADH:ubiquinone oxidoreductase subunit
MPVTDYSNTIMYKIVCDDLNVKDCYVGHTINMTKRKNRHKSACNNEKDKKHNYKIYKIIRQNGGWSNWSMLLVEEFPCKDKYEACKRERELYEELDAKMNTFRPYITQEETKDLKQQIDKQYREENKAEIAERMKQYYQIHKAEIIEKMKEKIQCEYCAKLLLKQYMSRHHKICKSKE